MSNQDKSNLGHGIRLTEKEYERRIVALHSAKPLRKSALAEQELRRHELDLAIDYRLGKDFPMVRREALWEIQQRVEKKRTRLFFYWLLHLISYRWVYRRANTLAGYLFDEYAKVLTKEELEAFFGIERGERPTLPIDRLNTK